MSAPLPAPVVAEPTAAADAPAADAVESSSAQVRAVYEHLRTAEGADGFALLHKPKPWRAVGWVACSWIFITASWALVTAVTPWFLPLALLAIASRQRALGVVLHDAAHGNVFARPSVSQWLLAAPLFEELGRYRRLHLSHHGHLADPELDPDFLPPVRGGAERRVHAIYLHWLLDRSIWLHSVFGEIFAIRWRDRVRIGAWWTGALALLSVPFGAEGALWFAALWMLSRATAYHAIKVFTELSDHVGLTPGSIISYTRNAPHSLLSLVLHPHDDGYHLTHHLAPRIPLANLARAHKLMMEMGLYRAGHHCDAYFSGPRAVVKGWVPPRLTDIPRAKP